MTTKKKYIQHNKQCFACGQEKAPSFLGYDIKTLKTYCLNKCKNKKDIPAVELIPATNEELVSGIVGNYSKDDEETIMSLLGKVASTRLRPAHILHVMKIAEMEGLPSLQATMLNIIEADMAARSMDDVELESYGQEREPEEEDILEMPMPEPEGYPISEEDIAFPEPPNIKAINESLVKKMEPVTVVINDKPVEPTREEIKNALEEIRIEQLAKKEEEPEDDNPFEF